MLPIFFSNNYGERMDHSWNLYELIQSSGHSRKLRDDWIVGPIYKSYVLV